MREKEAARARTGVEGERASKWRTESLTATRENVPGCMGKARWLQSEQ